MAPGPLPLPPDDLPGRPLALERLARLHGAALGRLGATAEVAHGRDYACARAWSAARHAHRDAPDGLLSPSRHDDGERCIALFDRAEDALGAAGGVPPLLRDPRLPALLDRWRLGFDPAG